MDNDIYKFVHSSSSTLTPFSEQHYSNTATSSAIKVESGQRHTNNTSKQTCHQILCTRFLVCKTNIFLDIFEVVTNKLDGRVYGPSAIRATRLALRICLLQLVKCWPKLYFGRRSL